MSSPSIGRAEACANIALAKYWGKSSLGDNLTAVPSLSLTLDALRTRTEVRFDDSLNCDELLLDDIEVSGESLERSRLLLDRIRELSGETRRASIKSANNFPTAAGLASSASGFAALAVAAAQAVGLEQNSGSLSAQARKSSASAARSLFGGFSILEAEADEAQSLRGVEHWDVAMVVGVIASGPKEIGSTRGMLHTKETSPYYSAWETHAPDVYRKIRQGVTNRDFAQVAVAMEHSTRLMHATMFTSQPPVIYLQGATIDLMHEVANRRAQGESMAYTMDAGPNIKVFTTGSYVERARSLLSSHPGVESTILCRPGPGATTLLHNGHLYDAPRNDNVVLGHFSPGRVTGKV